MSRVAGVAVGLLLFATPFLRYGVFGGHEHGVAPHSDHAARYGGLVVMVGDHHLEVVEHSAAVDVYISDARRVPLRPATGTVAFDARPAVSMAWQSDRLHATAPSFAEATYDVVLEGGVHIGVTVPSTR